MAKCYFTFLVFQHKNLNYSCPNEFVPAGIRLPSHFIENF